MSEDLSQEIEDMSTEDKKEKTREDAEKEKRQDEKEVVDRIIRGVNDTFEKEYNFDDIGMNFTVKIKAPNAIEIGKIQARLSLYLNGMNNYASEYMLIVYQTLATLRVVGKDLPKELAKDEDIYNLEILYVIGRDFQRWLDKFQF